MNIRFAIPAAFTLMASGAYAQDQNPPPMQMTNTGKPGQAMGTRAMKVTATVTAVDLANRTVTLQHKKNPPQTFSVDAKVTRLNEVAVGDTVVVTYTEGLMLDLQPAGSAPVTPQGVAVAEKNAAAPGGTASAGIRGTVTVTAINMKNRHVVFEGPGGNLYEVKAGSNVHLDKLKVGDKLTATYVASVAIDIQKAPKK